MQIKSKLKINKTKLWVEVDFAKVAGLTMVYDFDCVYHYTEALGSTAMDVWDGSVWGVPLPTVVFLSRTLWCFSQPKAFVLLLKIVITDICSILLLHFVHVSVGPPYTLRLKVKFYSSEPNSLREELTRYQFFLQLKQDILQGRLECAYQTAIELSAIALQCECCPKDKRTEKCAEFRECSFVILWGFKIRIFQCSF